MIASAGPSERPGAGGGGRLAGRVVVVTGGSRGIGRSIVAACINEGASVATCSRAGAGRDAGAAVLPPGVLHLACDVRDRLQVAGFAATVLGRLGPPDLLVNNAGTVVRAPIEELSEESWDEVLDANLKGTYLVTGAFLPAMRGRRRGRIVNIASISGRRGTAGLTAYCAAKHGVVGLTRALAEEIRPAGLQVNALCPGSVDTDMLAIGMPGARPQMTSDEIARTVLFLATDAPPALTGACIDVFG